MIKRRTRNQLQRSSRQVVAASTVPGEANKLLGEEIIKGDNKSCTSDITNTESNSLRTDDQSTCEHCSTRSSPIWRRGMHGELLCNACGLYWKHNGIYRPLMAALNRKSKQALESVVHNPGTETRKAPDRDAKRRLRSSAVPLPEPSIVKLPQLRKPSRTFRTVVVPNVHVPHGTLLRFGSSGRTLETIDYNQKVPEGLCPHGTKYVIYRGTHIFQGDYAAIKAADNQVYFVLVKDFVIEPDGGQSFRFAWLIPKTDCLAHISPIMEDQKPHHFSVGPDHPDPEPIESLLTVFHSPTTTPRPLPSLPGFCLEEDEVNEAELSAAHVLCDLG